jgi:hypothetical protein
VTGDVLADEVGHGPIDFLDTGRIRQVRESAAARGSV